MATREPEYPRDSSIVEVFERVADCLPDGVALVAGGHRFTYAELDAAANRIAHRLSGFGVAREARIGVAAERGSEAVVAYLGILKAGCAYVPLDPDAPLARQRFVLEDVGARLVIAEERFAERALAYGPPVLRLDPDLEELTEERADRPTNDVGPRHLMYVMFTSGSTGRPKGVAVEHRNVLRLARGVPDLMPHAGETVLGASRLDFDIATREIWGTLLNGACLALHPPGPPDPRLVGETVSRHGVVVAGVSTGLFHQLVEHSLERLAGLRLLMAGGDVLSPTHARRFLDAHPGCRLVNSYGPTEATVSASCHDVREVEPGRSIPIGHAEPHTALHVLDEDGRPAPTGQPGELYIGGDGVARGYLHRPELTRKSFLPDPFAGNVDARIYRTGDFVRRRADGALEFLGRRDRQLKVRGYRVEPAEIEARIAAAPGVEQAVVVPREDLPGHRQLVAYVVARAGGAQTVEAVRRRVAGELPAHLLPSALVALDELPLSPTGKVDHAALPPPHAASGRPRHRAPQTALERRIVEIWREALKVSKIGLDDDFFELGGDSLLAMRVLALLRDDPGVELPLSSLFDSPTPAGLARTIENNRGDAAPALPPLRRRPRRRHASVSLSQAQVCFLTELDPQSLAYQFQALVNLNGQLDAEALEQALSEIVRRHEIYRTTFPRQGGTWVQEIHEPTRVRLEVHDLSTAADPDAELERLAARTTRVRIEIDRLPLVRWSLAKLAPHRHVLLHLEHHLVHDGASFMLFLRELRELYTVAVEGRAASLPPLAVQYSDFAEWQRELVSTDIASEQLAYWTRRLRDAPSATELPYDRPPPARQTFRGRKICTSLPVELIARLRRQAQANGATLFMIMLSAFVVLLHRYGNTRDVVVGSGVSNRRVRDSEALIGMLVNTVALRTDLSGDPSARELLSRVRKVALEAFANQDVPFERVVQALAPSRNGSRAPLYQTLFSFHDSPLPELDGAGLTIVPDETRDNGSAKADVNVVAINHRRPGGPSDELTVVWEYNSDLFSADAAERMVSHYCRLLEALAADLDQRISRLELLGADEKRQLAAFAGRRVTYERDSTIAEVFLQRARERPDATALVGQSGTLSYRELNSQANRLAHRLRRLGVTRGTLVGICLERSPEMVVALLATLKAGGAYVPLDPSQPPRRLHLLAADAGVPVICTATQFRDRLPPDPQLVCLDEIAADLADEPDHEADCPAGPTDLAYVAYTSGSTGEPKGVEVMQRGVLRLVRGADYVELDHDQTLLALAPLAFDASTFEIWGALLNGARLALAPAGSLSPFEIAAAIQRHHVTTLWLTSGLFNRFVELEPAAVGAVRQLLAGGDVLSHRHVARALSLLSPDGVLVNGYGPTEGTTFTCCHPMRPGDKVPAPVPIGRPIANTSVHVLDERGMPAPIGVAGELSIGGDGVARGYLNRPHLTAERFVADRTCGNGQRLYRSGDLARWRPDGTIEFLGRNDRQVKIRGFRIEPAEVEAELMHHADVHDAVVVARGERADARRLVAYVVGRLLHSDRMPELRSFLAARVPAHLIPSAWIVLDRLPLTASGKVDHRALPEPKPDTRGGGDAIADELQREVARIFAEVLAVGAVGPGDDFFELGGHSLLAVHLFARIEERFGARLPLAAIFDAPTVEGIAAAIRGKTGAARWSSLVPVATSGSRPPFFVVTAGDGNSVGYGALGRRLPAHQPLYALQPRGLDGRARLHRTVESMAHHYVYEIRGIQAHGPYLLGGRCLGGLVAFEMARRLRAAGEEVALLAIFDSLGPYWRPREILPGLAYDEVMNLCRLRARSEGQLAWALRTRQESEAFLDWLREPARTAAPPINRYLHEAYLARPDVRAAYANVPGADSQRLVDWAWISGRSEMGLQPALLPEPSPDRPEPASNGRFWAAELARGAATLVADSADVALLGRSRRLTARRGRRLGEIAIQAAHRYRAGGYAGRITLIRTAEFSDDIEIARWHGVAEAEIDEQLVLGSHRSMLREPDVASLASSLDQRIGAALGERTNGSAG